jgi:hypothetical protein
MTFKKKYGKKFAPGDMVRVVDGQESEYNGKIGKIFCYDSEHDDFQIFFKDIIDNHEYLKDEVELWEEYDEYEHIGYDEEYRKADYTFALENQLQTVKIRNTKLARKVYPTAEEEGEWLCLKD